MKKLLTTLLILIVTITLTPLLAQDPAPPPPPGDHGLQGNQNADNGAPIGSGLFILLGLGAAYGGKKVNDFRKEMKNED